MNKLASNVCAFIYFQVTQLIYDCKEIKFPPYFSFLLLDSSRCEKKKWLQLHCHLYGVLESQGTVL